jgi:hypothetical protein
MLTLLSPIARRVLSVACRSYRGRPMRMRFPIERACNPDDPVAVFVTTLSIAFGDLRIVAKYVPRDDQPDHERIYFVNVMASHLREIVKVIDRQADAPVIEDFVATLSDEARARARIPEKLGATVLKDDERTLLDFLKRLRNDTFTTPTTRRARSACGMR